MPSLPRQRPQSRRLRRRTGRRRRRRRGRGRERGRRRRRSGRSQSTAGGSGATPARRLRRRRAGGTPWTLCTRSGRPAADTTRPGRPIGPAGRPTMPAGRRTPGGGWNGWNAGQPRTGHGRTRSDRLSDISPCASRGIHGPEESETKIKILNSKHRKKQLGDVRSGIRREFRTVCWQLAQCTGTMIYILCV